MIGFDYAADVVFLGCVVIDCCSVVLRFGFIVALTGFLALVLRFYLLVITVVAVFAWVWICLIL